MEILISFGVYIVILALLTFFLRNRKNIIWGTKISKNRAWFEAALITLIPSVIVAKSVNLWTLFEFDFDLIVIPVVHLLLLVLGYALVFILVLKRRVVTAVIVSISLVIPWTEPLMRMNNNIEVPMEKLYFNAGDGVVPGTHLWINGVDCGELPVVISQKELQLLPGFSELPKWAQKIDIFQNRVFKFHPPKPALISIETFKRHGWNPRGLEKFDKSKTYYAYLEFNGKRLEHTYYHQGLRASNVSMFTKKLADGLTYPISNRIFTERFDKLIQKAIIAEGNVTSEWHALVKDYGPETLRVALLNNKKFEQLYDQICGKDTDSTPKSGKKINVVIPEAVSDSELIARFKANPVIYAINVIQTDKDFMRQGDAPGFNYHFYKLMKRDSEEAKSFIQSYSDELLRITKVLNKTQGKYQDRTEILGLCLSHCDARDVLEIWCEVSRDIRENSWSHFWQGKVEKQWKLLRNLGNKATIDMYYNCIVDADIKDSPSGFAHLSLPNPPTALKEQLFKKFISDIPNMVEAKGVNKEDYWLKLYIQKCERSIGLASQEGKIAIIRQIKKFPSPENQLTLQKFINDKDQRVKQAAQQVFDEIRKIKNTPLYELSAEYQPERK